MAEKKKPLASRWECANCGLPEDSGVALRPCSRCKLVRYCGTECQAQHWKKGGHKQNCVAPDQRKPQVPADAQGGRGPKCAICLVEMKDEDMERLPCSHKLHAICVKRLRDSSAAAVCPLCRVPISGSSGARVETPAAQYKSGQRDIKPQVYLGIHF